MTRDDDPSTWPAWATEAVTLAPPDSGYPGRARRHADELARREWRVVPAELDRRERRLLVRVDAAEQHRRAHLHLWWPGAPDHDDAVAFRDRLRADPTLARAYAELERASAAAHRDDREAYTVSKGAFVAAALGRPATG